ncbi:MAG: glucose-6-phosphate isomerase, partial [bacterium]
MDKEKLLIHMDYSNVMAENVGFPHGLTQKTLSGYQEHTSRIHHDFLRRRERGEFAFMNLPTQKEVLDGIEKYLKKIAGRFENYVHIGIGGSALGPIALHSSLCHPYFNQLPPTKRNGSPRIYFLDNIDPDTIASLFDLLDMKKTLVAVVTKSGGTAETIASFLVFLKSLRNELGENYRDHLVIITDPLRGFLRKLADEEGISSFAIDPAVGGRFSVLTPVGLLPAAISGIDVHLLLDGAAAMTRICQREHLLENPAYLFALINYIYYLEGIRTIIMMPYSDRLWRVSDWFRQLWAESLGKKNNRLGQAVNIGPLPVNALGATDQHSQVQLYMEGPNDKLYTFIEVANFSHTVSLHSPYPGSSEAG